MKQLKKVIPTFVVTFFAIVLALFLAPLSTNAQLTCSTACGLPYRCTTVGTTKVCCGATAPCVATATPKPVPTTAPRCSYCTTGACGQCSDYALGWRCNCSGFNGATYSSCKGVLDSTCGAPQPTPTGIPVGQCNYCTTAACGQCSTYAPGWRCNCTGKVGNNYTSCLGVLDSTCGVAQPTPTPPQTYTVRYFCNTTTGSCGPDSTNRLYDTVTDIQYGGGPTCAANLGTYWPNQTTGICYKDQNVCSTNCPSVRYFCNLETNSCGPDSTNRLYYPVTDYQYIPGGGTGPTCAQNLKTYWSNPDGSARTKGVCHVLKSSCDATCPTSTPIPTNIPTPTAIPTTAPLKCEKMNAYFGLTDITNNLSQVKLGDMVRFTATANKNGQYVKNMTFKLCIKKDTSSSFCDVSEISTVVDAVQTADGFWASTYEYQFNGYGVHRIEVSAVTPQ